MPKFAFNKLVRDNIVDQQTASGARPAFRRLKTAEHKQQLVHKITEEAREILSAPPQELAAEIADVQQALDDLRQLMRVSADEVRAAQTKKNQKNGPFTQGLFVEYVEVAEDNPWVEYYRQNADRYPEIS